MKIHEFLLEQSVSEDTDVEILQLKSILTQKIKDLPDDNATAKALKEIEELLGSVSSGGKIGTINNRLKTINDESVNKAHKLLAKYILSLDVTPDEREDLFKRWKEDTLVNRKLLLSIGKHSITSIINGYDVNPAIKELTDDLLEIQALGQGKGEFLLSVFSKKIMKLQKGDLKIDNLHVEVKTNDSGAGRFFDQDVKPSQGWYKETENFINTFAKPLGVTVAKSGINMNTIVAMAQRVESSQRNKFKKSISNVISNIFPNENVNNIVNSIMLGNSKAALQSYAITNLNFYLNNKDDDGVLMINLRDNPISLVFFKNNDELNASGLRLHASTIYPISTDARNAYPQIKIVTSNRVTVDGGDVAEINPPKKSTKSSETDKSNVEPIQNPQVQQYPSHPDELETIKKNAGL